MTVQYHPFRLSIFWSWDRPLRFFKNVQFHPFGPSSFNPLDRPVFALETVYFDYLRPSSFIPFDRLLLSLETVQIYCFRSYSLFPLDLPLSQTVHFESFRPSTLAQDRLLSVVWTVQFNPPGSFTIDRTQVTNWGEIRIRVKLELR